MKLLLTRLLAMLFALTAFAAFAQTVELGTFDRVVGQVNVIASSGTSRLVGRGSRLASGEVVTTDENSEAVIITSDGARMILRAKSRLEITEYRFDKTNNDGSFLVKLIKGGLRSVTGLIGNTRPLNQRVATATATVGIRGTDFEVVVVEADSGDLREGTYDHVFEGATVLQLASGQTLDVPKDKTGLALANPRPGEAQLQLLDTRPAFIRGGGFDAMQLIQTRPQTTIRRLQ